MWKNKLDKVIALAARECVIGQKSFLWGKKIIKSITQSFELAKITTVQNTNI